MADKDNMKRKNIRRIGEVMVAVANIIKGGTVVVSALAAPNAAAHIAKMLFPDVKSSAARQRVSRSLLSLKQMGFIKYDTKDQAKAIKLTPLGEQMLVVEKLKGELVNLTVKKQNRNKWDRLWRILVFDIPEKFRKERDILRDFLKRLGFASLQKSAFIIPYPCQVEIDVLRESLRLTEYIHYFEASKIDNQAYWEDYFDL